MLRSIPLLLASALVAIAFAPAASAYLDCTPSNPLPPGPGGEVGRVYGFASTTAHGALLLAVGATCSTLSFVLATADGVCYFLLGTGCPP